MCAMIGVLSQGDGMKLGIQVAKQEELAFSVSDIISRIHDDARRGDFDITIDDTPVKFQHAALLSPAPLFVCSTGSVLRGSDCGRRQSMFVFAILVGIDALPFKK